MENAKNQLREDSIAFAISVSDICEAVKGCSVFVNQLLRASSSIGANIHEAKYAQSRADFVSKLEIALKESFETEYWLELLYRKKKLTEEQYKAVRNMCGSIRRRLISSITTAKTEEEGTNNTYLDSSKKSVPNGTLFFYLSSMRSLRKCSWVMNWFAMILQI